MNQIKVGAFIAKCRKEQNLTQLQLAQKLMVTDRAVSKWERGKGIPDVSIMLDLCEVFGITVNELLIGKRIDMKKDDQSNEKLLLDMAEEINKKNKIIWTDMWVIIIISIIALLGGLLVAGFLIPEGIWQLVCILAVTILFLIPCFYALKLEISVGAYKCKNCGHEIVPTYSQALNAMHRGTTRYLKCPKCNKRTWCKKVINKD